MQIRPKKGQPISGQDNKRHQFNNLTHQIKILDLLYDHKKAQTIILSKSEHFLFLYANAGKIQQSL